jgi:hypothetical protein
MRIPEIVETLSGLTAPVVDRAMCEQLFRVGRRRAIDLIQIFGGYRAGNAVLVDRARLLDHLRQLAADPDIQHESQRKERLSINLDLLKEHRAATRIIIKADPMARRKNSGGLPDGIVLQPGKLTIEFTGTEDLLSRLYALSQAAAADFEGFTALAEGERELTERQAPLGLIGSALLRGTQP